MRCASGLNTCVPHEQEVSAVTHQLLAKPTRWHCNEFLSQSHLSFYFRPLCMYKSFPCTSLHGKICQLHCKKHLLHMQLTHFSVRLSDVLCSHWFKTVVVRCDWLREAVVTYRALSRFRSYHKRQLGPS